MSQITFKKCSPLLIRLALPVAEAGSSSKDLLMKLRDWPWTSNSEHDGGRILKVPVVQIVKMTLQPRLESSLTFRSVVIWQNREPKNNFLWFKKIVSILDKNNLRNERYHKDYIEFRKKSAI